MEDCFGSPMMGTYPQTEERSSTPFVSTQDGTRMLEDYVETFGEDFKLKGHGVSEQLLRSGCRKRKRVWAPFYGYYTMDFKLDGKTYGMLSVNAFTGNVWYHSRHGNFLSKVEIGMDSEGEF